MQSVTGYLKNVTDIAQQQHCHSYMLADKPLFESKQWQNADCYLTTQAHKIKFMFIVHRSHHGHIMACSIPAVLRLPCSHHSHVTAVLRLHQCM
mgnify:CR=1 FL=1